VSSLGAVYRETLKEMRKLIGCSKPTLRKLANKMAETVIRGSMKIWREYAKKMQHYQKQEHGEAEERIESEIKIIQMEQREEVRKAEV
jgi:hypothetical protein